MRYQLAGMVNGVLRGPCVVRALEGIIVPYLRYRGAKYAINQSLSLFDRLIKYIQVRVRENFKYGKSRRQYLFHYWEREWTEMYQDLEGDDNTANQRLYKKMSQNTPARSRLVAKFLDLYLERCSFWHAFAFFQYRSTLEGADLAELKEIFEDRQ